MYVQVAAAGALSSLRNDLDITITRPILIFIAVFWYDGEIQ